MMIHRHRTGLSRFSLMTRGLLLGLVSTFAWAQQAPPVTVAKARIEPVVEEVPVTGTVTSPSHAQLSSAIGGLVKAVHVEAGERVESGQLLVTLDDELARHQLASLEAAVVEAQAQVSNAERRLQEAESLQSRRSIAKSEVEDRRAALNMAQAALAQRQADFRQQRARLERHTVEAPFAGVIASRMTASGEWVEPGTPLMELVDLAHLRIDYAVPQVVFNRVNADSDICVQPAGLKEPVPGRIERIVPVTDARSRTFKIHAVPEQAVAMAPGMSARGQLRLLTDREAVVIPRDGLMRQPSGRTLVWVIDDEGEQLLAHERRVTVGTAFGDLVAITEGLEAGERIVIRGNNRLREGQPVRIQ
ncbi:efflux RND transporter periplasmic adaptor subunit [Marinobacteraceae bacterium S3BR75-40.1]